MQWFKSGKYRQAFFLVALFICVSTLCYAPRAMAENTQWAAYSQCYSETNSALAGFIQDHGAQYANGMRCTRTTVIPGQAWEYKGEINVDLYHDGNFRWLPMWIVGYGINAYDPIKGAGPGCPKPAGCLSAGNPIDFVKGTKTERVVDLQSGNDVDLSFSRIYLGDDVQRPIGMFGSRWRSQYDIRVVALQYAQPEAVIVFRPSGDGVYFTDDGTGIFVGDTDTPLKLVKIFSGSTHVGWTLTDETDRIETYDAAGLPTKIEWKNGEYLSLAYDASSRLVSVIARSGRALTFSYDGFNRLQWLTDPAGAVTGYAYDANGMLSSVAYPGGAATKEYFYNETGFVVSPPQGTYYLTGVEDESDQRYASFTYDSGNRAIQSTHAGSADRVDISYGSGNSVTITDALGRATTRNWQISERTAKFTAVSGISVSRSGTIASLSYDAAGYPDIAIDFKGNQTDSDYNARGLESQRIEAANDTTGKKRTIQTDWDPSFRSPTERRVLDSAGALKAKTNWSYNARNQVSTTTATDPLVVPNATRTTAYTYCEQAEVTAGTCPFVGLLKSIDGPLASTPNDLTTYAYRQTDAAACATAPTTCEYRKGDLWKVTNALSQTVEVLKYDGAGRVLSVKDINDVITDFEYHPRGWLTARKVRGTDNAVETDDQITSIEYWPTGLVKKVTQPDGAFTSYTYDAAHRLTGIADNAGNTIAYTLNAVGERTQEDTKDSTGTLMRTLSRTYNTLGQLQTATDAYSRNTGFTYDANGNLDQTTDALTRVADNNYDPLDRLSRTLQDMNGIAAETKFAYDALDNLTQVNDPKGLNTDYTYNGFSELKTLVSPDTGTTQYTYDAAGNRASQTDARGKVTNYGYDALNRLTTVTYPTAAALNVAYTYDTPQADCLAGETFTKGRVSKIADQSGATVYCYDRFGQLVRKKQTVNAKVFTLRYVYLTNGRLDKIVYPDLSEARYLYDTQGRPKEVNVMTATGTVVQVLRDATYYPFGPANQWTYGNGRLMRRSLNQNYQPGFVEVTGGTGISIGYEFDEVGNLKKLRAATQTDPPQRIYAYDGLNRLTESRNGSTNALLHGYAYDKTGNRTSAIVGASTTTYTYPATNHRLGQVGANVRAYDNNGNTTQIPGTTTKNFVYGDNNRMTQVFNGATVAMNYVHNGKGELVRKYVGATNTYSLYDEAGHWLGDYNNSGAPTQQVIWFGDLPVGVLVGATTAQKLHYVEADALGAPRAVIDPTRGTQGTAVWTWNLNGEPFGTTAPSQNPDGDATSFVFNMRFPGQRYDSASGLNYNYFRDYEPGTGRYSQSDPIGLGGGISTYGYVGGNPLIFADQFGLAPGDTFASPEDAAIDMFNFIVSQTRTNHRWDPRNEVGGWIVRKGKCFTYRDEFGSGGGFSTGMPQKPQDAVAAFHTHSLTPFRDIRQIDFSRPGDVAGNPAAGDLSRANQNYYGLQFVGGFMHGGVDLATRRVIQVPRMFRNDPPSKKSVPVRMRTPEGCECNQ